MNRKAWLALVMVLCLSFPALAQKITVSGTVVDPTGEPLIGASVLAQGTTVGVATDFDGNYRLEVDANGKTKSVQNVSLTAIKDSGAINGVFLDENKNYKLEVTATGAAQLGVTDQATHNCDVVEHSLTPPRRWSGSAGHLR